MFDRTHNAKPTGHYDLCRGVGPWAGSWEGLPADVGIVNWKRDLPSLEWFASLGHEQVFSGNQPARIVEVLRKAAKIPGLVGVMYTTWNGNYGDLQAYAAAVKAYAATLPRQPSEGNQGRQPD